jgi:adenosine kinase
LFIYVIDVIVILFSNFSLQQLKEIKTGTCLCLCQGEERSLTANIGAALKVEKSFIEDKLPAHPLLYYIEGFFIPEKMNICRFLYEKFSKNSQTVLITNLNAPYIVKTFPKDVTWLTKKADIVFGNRDEFEELANINGFQTMEDLLTDLLNEYSGGSEDKRKIIVVTDGANPVFFYQGNTSGIESDAVTVPQVNADEIVDTTGAGDSFVAGFIHALMEGKSTRECIELGCEISAKVIKVIGCNLPKK